MDKHDENDMVICPECVHQFLAIPVNAQEKVHAFDRLAALLHEETVGLYQEDRTGRWCARVGLRRIYVGATLAEAISSAHEAETAR